ncbi:MAG: hypothetical protein ABWJ97_04645 [Thermoproteus sp.]
MCVKIPEELYRRLKKAAKSAGYDDVDKYVVDLLERVLADDEEITRRLRSWGYA